MICALASSGTLATGIKRLNSKPKTRTDIANNADFEKFVKKTNTYTRIIVKIRKIPTIVHNFEYVVFSNVSALKDRHLCLFV